MSEAGQASLRSTSRLLFDRAVAAFAAVGLDVTPNPDLHTFRVTYGDITTVVVVAAPYDAICAYAVWPELVPTGDRVEMSLLAARANSTLVTSALELDVSTGNLSARAAVSARLIHPDDDWLLGGLLVDAVAEANRALDVHRPAIAAVCDGEPAHEAIGLRIPD